MKNRLLIFIIFSVLLYSCSNNTSEGFFTIKGNFSNSKGERIFLSRLTPKSLISVDSVVIDENGDFVLKGYTNEPRFFVLRTSPTDRLNLLIDSAQTIILKADYKNLLKSVIIDGSSESVLLKELDLRNQITITTIDSLGKIYRAHFDKPSRDTIKQQLDMIHHEVVLKQKQFSIQFIEKNINSLTCLLALAQFNSPKDPVFSVKDDFEWFEKVDKSLFAKYPKLENVKVFHEFVDYLRNAKQETLAKLGYLGAGIQAPEISLSSNDGKNITLSSFRGKYVLIDFWASWSRPCRDQNSELVKIYWKYKGQKFEILQVSLDKTKEAWEVAIKQDNLTWIHVSDLKFWQSPTAEKYGVRTFPSNFLIDPEGKIIATNIFGEKLTNKLRELFNY